MRSASRQSDQFVRTPACGLRLVQRPPGATRDGEECATVQPCPGRAVRRAVLTPPHRAPRRRFGHRTRRRRHGCSCGSTCAQRKRDAGPSCGARDQRWRAGALSRAGAGRRPVQLLHGAPHKTSYVHSAVQRLSLKFAVPERVGALEEVLHFFSVRRSVRFALACDRRGG